MKIDLSDLNTIKEFVKNTESGIYEGVSEKGEKVILGIDKNEGFSARIKQNNGWYKILEYDQDGFVIAESYSK